MKCFVQKRLEDLSRKPTNGIIILNPTLVLKGVISEHADLAIEKLAKKSTIKVEHTKA